MKEMKYEEPRLEVLCFESQDIITTSPDYQLEQGENDTPYVPIA